MPKLRKRTPFGWRPVAIYLAIVLVVGVGLVLWDRAYEARQEALFSPKPETIAKNLVESFVGAGTVQNVKFDQRSEALSMDVKDVVTAKNKTPAQNRDLLSAEGTQAAQRVLGFVTFKHLSLRLVKDGNLEATVQAEPGKPPQTTFAPDFK